MRFSKGNAADAAQIRVALSPGIEKFFNGEFAFAQDYDVCSGIEILLDVRTGFRAPEGPYETIGGLVLRELGHIPAAGETVELTALDGDGLLDAVTRWRATVVRMDGRRIDVLGAVVFCLHYLTGIALTQHDTRYTKCTRGKRGDDTRHLQPAMNDSRPMLMDCRHRRTDLI